MSDGRTPFLALPPEFPLDDEHISNSIQPALDTLYSSFTRRQRTSPGPSTSPRPSRPAHVAENEATDQKAARLDFRALDYISGYDSHLMCPICHVPFIDPVVLDCDHTFCHSCYDEYTTGGTNAERLLCPSCRSYVLSSPKKASRLISNMCDDVKVKCPNVDCSTVLPRAYMRRHAERDCPEQLLPCPDAMCRNQTKRKNFVPQQCVHSSQVECDCGAQIQLGRSEWRRHKDEDCPHTQISCHLCGEAISVQDLAEGSAHQCSADDVAARCPGTEFGCDEDVKEADLESHVSSCVFSRLAPSLSRQSRLITSLADQLAQSKLRNEHLETGLANIDNLLTNTVQPKLAQLHCRSDHDHDHEHEHDVEEIHREDIPSAAAVHHRDLLLPAHLRDLTPSPTFSATHFQHQPYNINSSPSSYPGNFASMPPHIQAHAHLPTQHDLDILRSSISALDSNLQHLQSSFTELDARTSMALMNETLRLKEELAHTNAALFSTRAQVQWLLNRERVGMMRERGRSFGGQLQQPHQGGEEGLNISGMGPTAYGHSAGNSHGNIDETTTITAQSSASASTSPVFATSLPMMRRTSGGSQERVKL